MNQPGGIQLSQHFNSQEWIDEDVGIIPAGFNMKFIGILESIRAWGCAKLGYDVPLKITHHGGYRSIETNEAAGGGSESAHLNYNNMSCADITIPGISQQELGAYCLGLWAKGIISGVGVPIPNAINPCVHVDLEKIRPAKWRYE